MERPVAREPRQVLLPVTTTTAVAEPTSTLDPRKQIFGISNGSWVGWMSPSAQVTRRYNFNDIGLDLCHTFYQGWMILEANMNYGFQGLKEKGLDIRLVLRELMLKGKI